MLLSEQFNFIILDVIDKMPFKKLDNGQDRLKGQI